jgi:hypothetical protein
VIKSRRQLLAEIPAFAVAPDASPGDAIATLHEECIAAAVNQIAGRAGATRASLLRVAGLALVALVTFDRDRLRKGIG